MLIVQHLPAGFTGALAQRLDSISALPVREAVDGETLTTGHVLVAPGGVHTTIGRDRTVRLNDAPPVHGVRPSIDVTLDSVSDVFGGNACVAILTGMGRDGAEGAARLEAAGGKVFTQDEASSAHLRHAARREGAHILRHRSSARSNRGFIGTGLPGNGGALTMPASPSPEDDADWLAFRDALQRATGVALGQYKQAQLKRRLASVMLRRGIPGWQAFATAIAADPALFEQVRDTMTINVSEFFRQADRFTELLTTHIPRLRRSGQR